MVKYKLINIFELFKTNQYSVDGWCPNLLVSVCKQNSPTMKG